MKKLFYVFLSLFVFFITQSYSQTPIDSPEFEGIGHNIECQDSPSNFTCLDGNWYLSYIGMQYIYDININLKPNFTVAVLDCALKIEHEDIDNNLVRDISLENNNVYKYIPGDNFKKHGTATTSLFSGGIIDNDIGGRGIINARTLFLSYLVETYVGSNKEIAYDIDSLISGFTRLLNPTPELQSQGYYRPKIVNFSVGISPKTEFMSKRINFDLGKHLKEVQKARTFIENNYDVLFVFAVGNSSIDGKNDNGAIHYKYNSIRGEQKLQDNYIYNWITNYDPELDETNYDYIPLNNLIIVGSNDYYDILHGYSDFGESVDIVAPSGVFAAASVVDNMNIYWSYKLDENSEGIKNWYGYSFDVEDISNSPDISNISYPDINDPCTVEGIAYGASFSAPIVSGAAGILLSKDGNLTPSQLKRYLTQAPNLQIASVKHNSSKSYISNLLPGEPIAVTLISINAVPILNIETSMKWYEEENNAPTMIGFDNFNDLFDDFLLTSQIIKINETSTSLPIGLYLGINGNDQSSYYIGTNNSLNLTHSSNLAFKIPNSLMMMDDMNSMLSLSCGVYTTNGPVTLKIYKGNYYGKGDLLQEITISGYTNISINNLIDFSDPYYLYYPDNNCLYFEVDEGNGYLVFDYMEKESISPWGMLEPEYNYTDFSNIIDYNGVMKFERKGVIYEVSKWQNIEKIDPGYWTNPFSDRAMEVVLSFDPLEIQFPFPIKHMEFDYGFANLIDTSYIYFLEITDENNNVIYNQPHQFNFETTYNFSIDFPQPTTKIKLGFSNYLSLVMDNLYYTN